MGLLSIYAANGVAGDVEPSSFPNSWLYKKLSVPAAIGKARTSASNHAVLPSTP